MDPAKPRKFSTYATPDYRIIMIRRDHFVRRQWRRFTETLWETRRWIAAAALYMAIKYSLYLLGFIKHMN